MTPSRDSCPGQSQNLLAAAKNGCFRSLGVQILGVAVVLLIASLLLLGVTFANLHQSYQASMRSTDALLKLFGVEAKLVGIEMTVRGYALSGSDTFLTIQAKERAGMERLLDQLAPMLGDAPDQRQRLAKARAMIGQRLALYADLSRPGRAVEVAHAITDPATRRRMEETRSSLSALRVAEMQRLRARQAAVQSDGRYGLFVAVGIVFMAFITGGLGVALSRGVRIVRT